MPDKTTSTDYLIDMDLDANGGGVRLRDLAAFDHWLKIERDFWEWLNDRTLPDKFHFLRHHFFNEFNQITSQLGLEERQNTKLAKQRIEAFIGKYQNNTLTHSQSPESHFVIELRNKIGDFEALTALGLILKKRETFANLNELNNYQMWSGAVNYIMFRQGISKEFLTSNQSLLAILEQEYRDHLSRDVEEASQQKDLLERLSNEYTESHEKAKSDADRLRKVARYLIIRQRNYAIKQLEEFKTFYAEGLSLSAPRSYWKQKSKRHHKNMWGLFMGLAFYASAVGYMAVRYLPGMQFNDLLFWKNAGFELVTLTLVGLGVVFAVARALYKLAISQLHLHNDADERVTMVEAYLALREGGHVDERHIDIVLHRLFTPASDGIVKDELILTWADQVKSVLANRPSP